MLALCSCVDVFFLIFFWGGVCSFYEFLVIQKGSV